MLNIASLSILLIIALGLQSLSAQEEPDSSSDFNTLQIERGSIFEAEKFSYQSIQNVPTERSIMGFSIGYHPEFKTVIDQHPLAARELRRSKQYQVLQTGGQVIFYGLLVKQFLHTLKKRKQIMDGNFPGNPTPVVNSINLTIGAGIFIYGSLKKRKHKEKAIDIFNNTPIH